MTLIASLQTSPGQRREGCPCQNSGATAGRGVGLHPWRVQRAARCGAEPGGAAAERASQGPALSKQKGTGAARPDGAGQLDSMPLANNSSLIC